MNRIYSVCWNITEKCNELCEFCYRTLAEDLSLAENKAIADKLIEHGVEKITFAGGEPLLYKNLFELAEYIKTQKPSILLSLTTNGLLINKNNRETILRLFDWITFDLESTSVEYHKMVGRGEKHLSKNVDNILFFNNKINLKINTVATKQNINDIPYIWELIKRFNIKRWKIFRYYPINFKAQDNEDYFSITDEDYKNLKDRIMIITKDANVQIDFNDFEDFRTTYFSIFSNGTLKDNTGNVTCNILQDSIAECISSIDLTNHMTRKKAYEKFIDKK
ncbi:MAG: radical SAM protein [Bacilli bacterium]|nr:radical SAM protein [Bacilli bacterium]